MPRRVRSELEAENQFLRAELEAIADQVDDALESDDLDGSNDDEGFDDEDGD